MHKVLPQEHFVQRNQHNLHIRATLDNVKVALVLFVERLHLSEKTALKPAIHIKMP